MKAKKTNRKSIFTKAILSLMVAATLSLTACQSANSPEVDVKIGSLKGPTSIGLTSMMDEYEGKKEFSFSVKSTADELVGEFSQKKVDIALVPANLASVLYNKTGGKIKVIDINTLGVLYIVSDSENIKSIDDLKGKTLFMTGKGTTPDYVLQAILSKSGIKKDEIKIEYKSQPTEVAQSLAKTPNAVALLPQPFAKAVTLQNKNLKINIDLNKEWNKLYPDSKQVTGVTIARADFIEKNPNAVSKFMQEHKKSVESVNKDTEKSAKSVVKHKILDKEPLAKATIPLCNVVYIDGKDMKSDLSGYLNTLSKLDPKSVGGKLPKDDFYYVSK